MDAFKAITKPQKRNAAIGCLVTAVVFYTLAGIIIALNPSEAAQTQKLTKEGQEVTDNYPDQMSKIQIAARVMPSQNTENNFQLMTSTNAASGMSGYYADGITDDVTEDRYELNVFNNYFPSFEFNAENVPLGTSKPYCLHFDWIEKKRANLIDMYSAVQNMPFCAGAVSPKVRWDNTYPKTGLDFKLFKQSKKEVSSAE